MKKSMLLVFAVMFGAATTSYAQSTSESTGKSPNPDQPAQDSTASAGGAAPAGGAASGGAQPDSSAGGGGNANAGAVKSMNTSEPGRFSNGKDTKSMLNSKEALEERKKNLTESDTTMKKGSGSAPKNRKDRTGKTGNYQNQEIKHNQKTSPRP